MAVPAMPVNVYLQQGNGQTYLSWDITSGATGYSVRRSLDGVSYVEIATPSVNNYLDTAVSVNTLYYYQVGATNAAGTGLYSNSLSIIPTLNGQISLGELRLRSQQTADRVNSNFLTLPEWNFNINQSATELYDLLITTYEDYFMAPRVSFATDGTNFQYDVPNGANYNAAPALYKLYGVDIGLDNTPNAWCTLKKFDFIQRNRYVFPQVGANYLGVFNLQYRMIGSKIHFIPTPSAGQIIGLWYYPRLSTMLQDTDILDGVSGWSEYVIVDAAIKALQKEESDTTKLEMRKQMLKTRIEESASNRDAGQPDTISDTRQNSGMWGSSGNGSGFDGPWGGY